MEYKVTISSLGYKAKKAKNTHKEAQGIACVCMSFFKCLHNALSVLTFFNIEMTKIYIFISFTIFNFLSLPPNNIYQ